MAYAIDLSARQTTRTLEQAVRHQCEIILTPLAREKDDPIACRLDALQPSRAAKRPCLLLTPLLPIVDPSEPDQARLVPDRIPDAYLDLVGTYCDVVIQLGENRYLFSGDVVNVTNSTGPESDVQIFIARPDTLQVAQRRRFRRFTPAQSAQVHFDWKTHEGQMASGIGWLCNVSGDGLACRTSTQVADQLHIGGQLSISFVLGQGEPELYRLEAVLCNKTPAGSKNTMILGIQFLSGESHAASQKTANALRQHLLNAHVSTARTTEGADQ